MSWNLKFLNINEIGRSICVLPSCFMGEVTILQFVIVESHFVHYPLYLYKYIIICNRYQRIEL